MIATKEAWGNAEPVPTAPPQSRLDKDPYAPAYVTPEATSYISVEHALGAELEVRRRMQDLVTLRANPDSPQDSLQVAMDALRQAQSAQGDERDRTQEVRRGSSDFANWYDHWAGLYVLKGSLDGFDDVVGRMTDDALRTIHSNFSSTSTLLFAE